MLNLAEQLILVFLYKHNPPIMAVLLKLIGLLPDI